MLDRRAGGIRTPGLLLPKQARYRTTLPPEDINITAFSVAPPVNRLFSTPLPHKDLPLWNPTRLNPAANQSSP